MNNLVTLTMEYYEVIENDQIRVTFFRFDGVRKVKVYKNTKGANYAGASWKNQAMKAWIEAGRPSNEEALNWRLFKYQW